MALSQSHFRFGSVDGTESTHGWLAGQDRDCNRMAGAVGQFLLRFCVQETAGVAENNVALQFQYQLTSRATETPGGWNNITTTSSVVRTGTNAVFSNNANCTQRLSGTGTFEASGAGCTTDGTSGGNANDIAANGNSETLIGLQILGADTAVGDLIEFRLARASGAALDAYDVAPSLRVATEILPAQSYDNTTHFSQSASVNRISGTLVAIECFGISSTDLADDTLSMTIDVWGTTVPGSTDPADYTTHLYGPDGWHGGIVGKDGMLVTPGFSFAASFTQDIRRVLATFTPSRTVTFGAQATLAEM